MSVSPSRLQAFAELAGKALKATGGSNAIDAIVMASAARRGDVYTADLDELSRLCSMFSGIRISRA